MQNEKIFQILQRIGFFEKNKTIDEQKISLHLFESALKFRQNVKEEHRADLEEVLRELAHEFPGIFYKSSKALSPSAREEVLKRYIDSCSANNSLSVKRRKAVDILQGALSKSNKEANLSAAFYIALEIERMLFLQKKELDARKIRSLVFSLTDPKNPRLCQNVYEGKIPISAFVSMSIQEMANDYMKQMDDEAQRSAILNISTPKAEAETTIFTCGKCKSKKTSYRQAQTRSADEPMTTFVVCIECGNKWKFC